MHGLIPEAWTTFGPVDQDSEVINTLDLVKKAST